MSRAGRILGAATAASVLAATAGAAAPAPAATGPLPYACQVLGQARTFVVQAQTDAPSRLAFGETVAAVASVSITLPEDVTTTLRDDLRAVTADGQLALPATTNKKSTPWTLLSPRTPLPGAGSSLVLAASLPPVTFAGRRVGQTWRLRIGAQLSGTIGLYRADGSPTSPVPTVSVSCTLATGKERALVQRITTVKDTTTTIVRGKDTAKGERGRARIRVVATHGRTPRGEVRVKLYHRGDLVSDRVLALEKGKARLRTRRLEERGWSVTAKYLGSGKLRGSHGADKIKVR